MKTLRTVDSPPSLLVAPAVLLPAIENCQTVVALAE
jgi:hypothetical protein